NGFFSCPAAFGTSQFGPRSVSPFQTPIGNGSYYLTDSSGFRGVGLSIGIASSFLSDLKTRTTSPPLVYSSPTTTDTLQPRNIANTGTPDLGYHYDVIDYAMGGVTVSGCALNVAFGTVIATYATSGNSTTPGLKIGSA